VAFASTAGVRTMIVGIVNLFTASLSGRIADQAGTYEGPFFGLVALTLAGAVVAFAARPPGPAPQLRPTPTGVEPAPEKP
jgi:hypothetical protein